MATFHLTAGEWKKVAKNYSLRGRSVKVTVTTGRSCRWDKRPGLSGSFTKSKTSNLLEQSFWVKSPVDTTLTRTYIDQW